MKEQENEAERRERQSSKETNEGSRQRLDKNRKREEGRRGEESLAAGAVRYISGESYEGDILTYLKDLLPRYTCPLPVD